MKTTHLHRLLTALALTTALSFATPAPLRAAQTDTDVIVASDRPDSAKKFTQPTAQKPAYCLFLSAGPKEMGDAIANEKIPTQKEVEPLLLKALARQYYLPAGHDHPKPDYVIIYTWGSINTDDMETGDTTTGDDSLAGNPLSQTQNNRQQMLSIVATNKLDLHPNSVDNHLFLPSLSDGRYFLLVAAYDFAELAAGKPRKTALLWRTRLSVYSTSDTDLAAAIPMMLDAAPNAFGADGYPKTVVGKLREGHVKIGEAKVVDYITGTNGARQAPASPATSGTTSAKPPAPKNNAAK